MVLESRPIGRAGSYIALASGGFFSHLGAVWLTFVIIGNRLGREANPVFYLMGPPEFIAFGFGVVAAYYFCVWKIHVPTRVKYLCAGIMTVMSAFDFMHDFAYLMAQTSSLHFAIAGLARIAVLFVK